MGFFSRNKSGPSRRPVSRAAASSEAQAAELRGRARRRLIGALALVVAAVIIVPMLFDDPASQQPETPLVLPAIVPPAPSEPDLALAPQESEFAVQQPMLPEGAGDAVQAQADAADQATPPASSSESSSPAEDTSAATRADRPEPQPAVRAENTPPAAPSNRPPAEQRTDDGSVALALLEGREVPSASKAPPSAAGAAQAQGSFVLQIAAYSTEADAQARRSRLAEAGVTNAYVEKGVSNDKTTYRLRVGSFPTRDAAQAAQTRLRALGYDNSMLLSR